MVVSKKSVTYFRAQKEAGQRLCMLTAYDFLFAELLGQAGVDAILVGDSVANVVQGRPTTLSVTVPQMIYHAEMVVRAAPETFVVVDLPFPFCQSGPKKARAAAARIIQETGADAVKIEGGQSRSKTIRAVVEAGIPVMGHCGLLPQTVLQLGGYVSPKDEDVFLADVDAVEQAGAFAVVLECVSSEFAAAATSRIKIPTIGIGAGPHCDGQVLVLQDLLGLTPLLPKHAKPAVQLRTAVLDAVTNFCNEVRN